MPNTSTSYPTGVWEACAPIVASERLRRGWSQLRLAAESGRSQTAIVRAETTGASADVLQDIAGALKSWRLERHIKRLRDYDRDREAMRDEIMAWRERGLFSWLVVADELQSHRADVRAWVMTAHGWYRLERVYAVVRRIATMQEKAAERRLTDAAG